MTRAKSYDQDAEECPYFLIQPDPRCAECATIIDWRSAHRWIAITNGAEIRLSDYGWEFATFTCGTCESLTRRTANSRNRRGKNVSPCGVVRSCSSPSPSLPSSGRPHSPAAGAV